MQLSDQLINSFQGLYKQHFGKEISKAQALSEGIELVRFISAINNLNNIKDYEKLHNKRSNISNNTVYANNRIPRNKIQQT